MKYVMQKNGFCQGIKLKRNPTWDETIYCLNEILGFDVDYALYLDKPSPEELNNQAFCDDELDDELDDYAEELAQEKEEIHNAFIDFIKGEITWNRLCDVLYCYDDIDEFTIGIIAYLLKYLEENEII